MHIRNLTFIVLVCTILCLGCGAAVQEQRDDEILDAWRDSRPLSVDDHRCDPDAELTDAWCRR